MKHTKGEWKMTIDGEANFYGILNNNNWLMRIQQNGELLEEEQLSNAKLIAAAPVLLDALISIDERLKKCSNLPINANEIYDSFYKDLVEQAIKKATE